MEQNFFASRHKDVPKLSFNTLTNKTNGNIIYKKILNITVWKALAKTRDTILRTFY